MRGNEKSRDIKRDSFVSCFEGEESEYQTHFRERKIIPKRCESIKEREGREGREREEKMSLLRSCLMTYCINNMFPSLLQKFFFLFLSFSFFSLQMFHPRDTEEEKNSSQITVIFLIKRTNSASNFSPQNSLCLSMLVSFSFFLSPSLFRMRKMVSKQRREKMA